MLFSSPYIRRSVSALALCALPMLITGCQSARFKLVKEKNYVEPVPLSLTNAEENPQVVVETVIVYQGPGSWKQEANWDEYILKFLNSTDTEIVFSAPQLIDFEATRLELGVDPWELEDLSLEREDRLIRMGTTIAKGALTGVLLSAGVGTVAITAALSINVAAGATVTAFGVGGALVALAAPGYYGYSLFKNRSNRIEVERVFAERALDFPFTLAPGEAVVGSAFFPLAPGPQRLEVPYDRAGFSHVLTVDLSPLANLHFEPEEEDEEVTGDELAAQ